MLNEYVNLFATYGYLDADYKDFMTDLNPNDDGLGQNIEDASHLTPRNAPENTFGVGGTASFPAGPGQIELYAKYNFVDEIETNLVNAEFGKLDSREYVNASVGYSWKQHECHPLWTQPDQREVRSPGPHRWWPAHLPSLRRNHGVSRPKLGAWSFEMEL